MDKIWRWLRGARGKRMAPTPAEAISKYVRDHLMMHTQPHVPGKPLSPDVVALGVLGMLGNQVAVDIGMPNVRGEHENGALWEILFLQFFAIKTAAANILGASQAYTDLMVALDHHIIQALPDKQALAELMKSRDASYEKVLRDFDPGRPGDTGLQLGYAFCSFCGIERDFITGLAGAGFFSSTLSAAQDLIKGIMADSHVTA